MCEANTTAKDNSKNIITNRAVKGHFVQITPAAVFALIFDAKWKWPFWTTVQKANNRRKHFLSLSLSHAIFESCNAVTRERQLFCETKQKKVLLHPQQQSAILLHDSSVLFLPLYFLHTQIAFFLLFGGKQGDTCCVGQDLSLVIEVPPPARV